MTEAVFRETTAEPRTQSVPLAHLSLELGHLYMEDFEAGPERLREHFAEVRVWVDAARAAAARRTGGKRPRISTCFLIDDYFTRFSSPAEVIPELIRAARKSDLEIDYLARESGCAEAEGVPLARLVEGRLVADPAPNTNGSRPATTETGWLCNGQRSPVGTSEAMAGIMTWAPPSQNAANRHSIFVDIELWNEDGGKRVWSCPFLAAVWQILRMGLLRNNGDSVATPQPWPEEWPDDWDRIPAIIKLNPAAAPFSAYRTLSVLSTRFLPIEHAVRTILSQVAVERGVAEQVVNRGNGERLRLPPELVDRIEYVFTG